MNLDKVKSYSSSGFIDKNKNPITINDILLSSNRLCIYLKNANDKRILVGFDDGKISSANPNKLIRVDCEVEKLKKYFSNLSENASLFNTYKRKSYYIHTFNLVEFYEQYRNRSKRLLSKKLKEKTIEYDYREYSPIGGILYMLNGEYYVNRYNKNKKVLIDEPYIDQPPMKGNCVNSAYAFHVNSFEYDINEVYNLNEDKIIDLLIKEINTTWS